MEANFSPAQVYDFLKLLIETGEVFYVDANHCIYETDSRTPVGVKVNNAKKQIALFKEGTKIPPNSVYLNPFDEMIGNHPEQSWFMNVISIIPGCLILHTIRCMAELINSKTKDTKFKTAEILSKFVGRVDEKFIKELDKVRAVDAGVIFYDKTKHIAQLLCDFWQPDFEEKMKAKMRKSSLVVLREMTAEILGTETPEEMYYKATLIACPKFDAVVHVLSDVLTRISPTVEKVTKYKLHADELVEHLKHIEAYHKALQWLATSSASPMKEASSGEVKVSPNGGVPWNVTAAGSSGDLNVEKSASMASLGNVEVVGVTKNPTFAGGGITKNPTFGMGGVSPIFGASPAPVYDPGIAGLGRVSAVVPSIDTSDFGSMTTRAAASMFGGVGGGFGSAFG